MQLGNVSYTEPADFDSPDGVVRQTRLRDHQGLLPPANGRLWILHGELRHDDMHGGSVNLRNDPCRRGQSEGIVSSQVRSVESGGSFQRKRLLGGGGSEVHVRRHEVPARGPILCQD